MKKYLSYCCTIILFVLFSCSNEEYMESQNMILPKTLKTIYPNNPSENFDVNIVYNGNKIVSTSNKLEKTAYSYNGNYIASETKYDIRNGQEIKYFETFYEYENESLKTVSKIMNGEETRSVYTKNGDDSITKEIYDFDVKTKKISDNPKQDVLTILNGNLINLVFNWGSNDVMTCSRFQYDAHYNAFKNVLGFNVLLDQEILGSELSVSSFNNLTRHSYSSIASGSIIFEPYSNSMVYEYNKKGYPTKKTTYDYADKIISIIEYVY
ncbi:hypothetical protein [Flavobacterium panacagri]|uniref:hypothetical protein n=1 Tax=Flavobacterium panacagri TaxID=3034146 RepID=UPI0025A54250|nr:hypothetical protein [Flavobacterium panacagri]